MILDQYIKSVFVNVKNFWYWRGESYVDADVRAAIAAGIEHFILLNIDWSVTAEKDAADVYARILHGYGRTFAISPCHLDLTYDGRAGEINVADIQHNIDEANSLSATLYARYKPDSWYVDCEFPVEFPVLKNSSGVYITSDYGLWGRMMKDIILAYLAASNQDVFISPMYGTYNWAYTGTNMTNEQVYANFSAHMYEIRRSVLSTTKNLYCAVQDGVGPNTIVFQPRRIIGSVAHNDLLEKFGVMNTVCNEQGWRFCVNVELYDMGGYPPTWTRIKSQLDTEGVFGVGPCWEYSAHMSPTSTYAYSTDLYREYCTYRDMTYCRTS